MNESTNELIPATELFIRKWHKKRIIISVVIICLLLTIMHGTFLLS